MTRAPDIPVHHAAHGLIAVVPNALSGARLTLAAVFPLLPPAWWAAAIIVAGLTDLVDGFIARRVGAASWVGGLLDAIADKAFVLAVLVTFAVHDRLAPLVVPALLARDFAVAFIAAYAAAIRCWAAFRNMPARAAGKLTTAAMFVLLVAVAAFPDAPAVRVLTLIAAALSAAAAVDYLAVFVRAEVKRVTGR